MFKTKTLGMVMGFGLIVIQILNIDDTKDAYCYRGEGKLVVIEQVYISKIFLKNF